MTKYASPRMLALAAVAGLGLVAGLTVAAHALSPTIARYLIGAGGGRSTASGYVVQGSIGQSLAGTSSGGDRRLAWGFWPGLGAVPTPEATLTETPTSTQTATPTATSTPTPTQTSTAKPTGTATLTATSTASPTQSPTSSPSATTTQTATATATATQVTRWAYLPLVRKP